MKRYGRILLNYSMINSLILLNLVTSCSWNSAGGSMVVITLNIRYDNPADAPNDWQRRLPIILQTITDEVPDLIGFQEVLKNQLDDLDSSLPGYDHVGVGRDDGKESGEFSPIFYKKDRFRVIEKGTFWLSQTPSNPGSIGWDADIPRIVTWARMKDMHVKRRDKPYEFYFLNTHFDHRGDTARLESVKLILDFIKNHTEGLDVVLTGDFNFDPSRVPYKLITDGTGAQPGLRDACRPPQGDSAPAEPTFNGFGKAKEGRRIDFIFLSGNWDVISCKTLKVRKGDIFISDHYPVVSRIR